MSDDRHIKLGGGYWLCSDQYCCWISKEYVTKEGKNAGKTYLKRYSGYTSNIEDALESVVNRYGREINARSVNSLINEIKSLKTLIKQIGENLDERTRSGNIAEEDTKRDGRVKGNRKRKGD